MPENSGVQFPNLITLDSDSFIMGHDDRSQLLLGVQFSNHFEYYVARSVVKVPCRLISQAAVPAPQPAPGQSPRAAVRLLKFHQLCGLAGVLSRTRSSICRASVSVSALSSPRINRGIIVFSSAVNSGRR